MSKSEFKSGLRAIVLERLAQRSALKLMAEEGFLKNNLKASQSATEALRDALELPECPPVCNDI